MKRLLTICLVVIVMLEVVNATLAGPIYLVNEFDIPDIPGAEFLHGSGLASDGTDLFILLRFTASLPLDKQNTIIKTNTSGSPLAIFDPFEGGGCLTFHNGRLLRGHGPVPGTVTTEIIIFDPLNGTELGTLPSPTNRLMTGLTSDGTNLFALDQNESIFVMDPDTGAILNTFYTSLPGHGLTVALAFSNGNLFAARWDTISMLNPSDGSVLDSFDPVTSTITGMSFINEELYVIDCGSGKIHVYSFIPEPAALILGSIGVGLVGWLRRRRTL